MAISFNSTDYVRYSDGKYRPTTYVFGEQSPYFTIKQLRLGKDGLRTYTVTFTVPHQVIAPVSGAVLNRSATMSATFTSYDITPLQKCVDVVYLLTTMLTVANATKLVTGSPLE